jgi:hypothetical protein
LRFIVCGIAALLLGLILFRLTYGTNMLVKLASPRLI